MSDIFFPNADIDMRKVTKAVGDNRERGLRLYSKTVADTWILQLRAPVTLDSGGEGKDFMVADAPLSLAHMEVLRDQIDREIRQARELLAGDVEALDRRSAGELRIRTALEHVEEAQREIGRASADLSSVIGYIPEGQRLRKLYQDVKNFWYRLEAKLRKPQRGTIGELDRDPKPGDQYLPHGCGR